MQVQGRHAMNDADSVSPSGQRGCKGTAGITEQSQLLSSPSEMEQDGARVCTGASGAHGQDKDCNDDHVRYGRILGANPNDNGQDEARHECRAVRIVDGAGT